MGGSLPALVSAYDRLEKQRDRFAILAFHDSSAKTFQELDEQLNAIVQKRWKGRALPFPILLDATGETVKRYGVSGFPTTILIDPQGRIVGKSSAEALEEILSPADK